MSRLVESLSVAGRMFARALRGARRHPLVQLVAVGTVALSLTLVGAVELVAYNVGRLESGWGAESQLVVWLEDGPAEEVAARADKIGAALKRLPGVETVRTVEPGQAWERLRRSLGRRADLLTGVEPSFLPTSVEVRLKRGVASVMRAHPAFERLQRTPGVEEVELRGDWTERLRRLERLLLELGLGVALLVGCACLYVVGSTIKLAVLARRDEIAIQKLVGATNAFVQGPFLVEGTLQGAVGAALASGLLYGLYRLAAPRIEAVLGDLMLAGPVRFFGPIELALVIGFGALLGFVGSALALGRYLREAPAA